MDAGSSFHPTLPCYLHATLSIQAYEQQAMVPAQSNNDVAEGTTNELLHAAPEAFGIKDFLRRITVCLLDERVRIAMM